MTRIHEPGPIAPGPQPPVGVPEELIDATEYLPMFVAEAREHLQELNLAVVRIEESPDDQETVNEIFRIAHSMKGMSATMGFEHMAALTHEMEDVFELLRQRTGGLPREAIDVLLASGDALGAAIERIEATGEEHLEPDELIESLRALVRARSAEQPVHRTGAAAPLPPPEVVAERARGRRIVCVEVRLADDCAMPSVRAFMVLNALGEHGSVLASAPAQERVDAFDGRRIEAWLAAEATDEDVRAAACQVADVHGALVTAITDEDLAAAAEHAASEDVAVSAAPGRRATNSVRVDSERLDQLMHAMGELIVHRTRVEQLAGQAAVPGLSQAMADLTRVSQALQALVMQVRMVPVEAVFLRLPRLVRDLSAKLDKQVELRLVGQDTELDRRVVDALGDPLVHLVRNSLDHGLEPPAERIAAGKPPTGVVEISAARAGGNVIISVRDDGRGIDLARIAAGAVQRGLIDVDAAAAIDLARATELLFAPGFSTAEATSDVSGRGVGMDVVRTTVRELGGDVVLTSEAGAGTTIQIRLPLTLAIVSALLVEVHGRPYAVPVERIERTVRLEDHAVRDVAGSRMLVLRDGALPLLDGGRALRHRAGPSGGEHAVIVTAGERRIALTVNRLVGQREVVTRPLPTDASDRAPVSGGAVLASGDIALIVDCDALQAGGPLVVAAA